jgi:hypothetical protein
VLHEPGVLSGFERLNHFAAFRQSAITGELIGAAAGDLAGGGGVGAWGSWQGVAALEPARAEAGEPAAGGGGMGWHALPRRAMRRCGCVRLCCGEERVGCVSTLGPKGPGSGWTYFFVGRPITLMVPNSRFGPAGHGDEPHPLHL